MLDKRSAERISLEGTTACRDISITDMLFVDYRCCLAGIGAQQVTTREERGGEKGGGCAVSWMFENGRYDETLRMVSR